jgi:hypothetical protein
MSTLDEKQALLRAAQDARGKDQQRLGQVALAVLRTDDGRELLAHLVKRFDLSGRTFMAGEKGEVNALRAAIRDGERAAVRYLIDLARRADKDFSIPL